MVADAGAGHLLLTHLWPGTDPEAALTAAAEAYGNALGVAVSDFVLDLP